MRQMRNAGLAVLALAVSASAAVAQAKGKWEVGTDVVGIGSSKVDGASGSTTVIGVNPGATIRAGKMVTDKIQVEPHVSFSSASDDSFSSTTTELGVAALFIFKAMEEAKPGFYVRGSVGMSMDKFESGGSTITDETRTNFGAGVGMKRKAMGIIWRAELGMLITPEKDASPSRTDMGLTLGGGFTP